MAFRRDLPFWQIFIGSLQDFDRGKVVEETVPADWNLKPGDTLEYEAGCNIAGIAEVVSVGSEPDTCWDDGEEVPGTKCTFRKIS